MVGTILAATTAIATRKTAAAATTTTTASSSIVHAVTSRCGGATRQCNRHGLIGSFSNNAATANTTTAKRWNHFSLKLQQLQQQPQQPQLPCSFNLSPTRQNHQRLLQQQQQQQQRHFMARTRPVANNSGGGFSSSSSSTAPPSPTTTTTSTSSTTPIRPKVLPSDAGTGRTGAAAVDVFAENKTPVTWTMLFLIGVAAASAVAYYRIERERRLERAMGKIVSTGKPAIGGPWSLVDLQGNLVTEQSFKGKWLLLYFGFARCPDICPSEMNKVGQVMDTLKKKHPDLYQQVVPVFVSVDPARDSLKALRAYAQDFHPDYIYLTGAPVQVQRMAKHYRVYVSKAEEDAKDGDYLVDHSIVIYFHDDQGELSDCFTQSMRASDVVEKIVEKMTNKPTGLLK